MSENQARSGLRFRVRREYGPIIYLETLREIDRGKPALVLSSEEAARALTAMDEFYHTQRYLKDLEVVQKELDNACIR